MSTTVRFLEELACRSLSMSDYVSAVAALDVEPEQRKLLLEKDVVGLTRTLGGRPVMRCMVMAAEENVGYC